MSGFDRRGLAVYVNNPSAWVAFDQCISDEIEIGIKRIAYLEAESDRMKCALERISEIYPTDVNEAGLVARATLRELVL